MEALAKVAVILIIAPPWFGYLIWKSRREINTELEGFDTSITRIATGIDALQQDNEALTIENARLTAQRDELRRLVYVLMPLMPALSEIVAMRDEVADALAAADRVMRDSA